jgi:hypothetical protein
MRHRVRRNIAAWSSLVVLLTAAWGQAAVGGEEWQLAVRRGIHAGPETPVLVRVSPTVPVGTYALQLQGPPSTGEPRVPVDAQVLEDSGRWLAFVTNTPITEGRGPLRLTARAGNRDEGGVDLVPSGGNLRIEVLGRPFSEYRTDTGAKPYFYPLIGPTGVSYTRAYPMENIPGEDRDHPHQRSLWFTHGSVNGVDFWSEEAGHGTIRETARKAVISGQVAGRLRTTNDWLAPDGKRVCSDERVVTFYRTRSIRVLDFEITLKAVEGPVTLGDTKEGMFGLRVASSMDVSRKQGGRIVNAEGLTDEQAWGKASAWVDYRGPIAGKTVGIAVLNHPGSFRHPTTWHVRTYGLFAANPFGWHDFGLGKSGAHTLPVGQNLWFGYRVILHENDAASARIADQFTSFSQAPELELIGR